MMKNVSPIAPWDNSFIIGPLIFYVFHLIDTPIINLVAPLEFFPTLIMRIWSCWSPVWWCTGPLCRCTPPVHPQSWSGSPQAAPWMSAPGKKRFYMIGPNFTTSLLAVVILVVDFNWPLWGRRCTLSASRFLSASWLSGSLPCQLPTACSLLPPWSLPSCNISVIPVLWLNCRRRHFSSLYISNLLQL